MLALVLAPVLATASSPIKNLEGVPISLKADGSPFADQEVRAAIIEGCIAKRWLPEVNDDGAIRATILVRQQHFAEVEITYTPTTYSIMYVSSRNLDYNAKRQRIHGNYNKWIVNLSASIGKSLSKILTSTTTVESRPDAGSESNQQDVYSELLKLDDLRQKGILTDEEFEAQKKKLLEAN